MNRNLSDFSEASPVALNHRICRLNIFPDCPKQINLLFMQCKNSLPLSLKNTATGLSYVSCLINNWVSVTHTKYSWLVIGSNNGCHVYLKKAFTFSTAEKIRHTMTSSAVEIMKTDPQKWLEREDVIWDAIESLLFTIYGVYC